MGDRGVTVTSNQPLFRRLKGGSRFIMMKPRHYVGAALLIVWVWGVVVILSATAHASTTGLDLTHHRVVVSSSLPSCTVEDGSAGPLPCSWNINDGDGNGEGLVYWLDARNGVHYVWGHNPIHGDWSWVPGTLRQTLRNEGLSLSVSCEWRQDGDDYSTVRCASGKRYTINY